MYALLLYSSYSMECLEKPISDTMNPFLMQLFEALSQARTDSYTAVANALRNINLSGMTTQQIIDYFSSKIGKIPLPTSMKKPNEFMENTHNLGAFLEAFVVDWKTLFESLRNPSEQVNMILMSVIDVLRSVYTENPEFRYTTRLIDVLKAHGVVVTKPVRMFCQACVAAMNLMCSCLSIGYLQLIVWVPSSEPAQLIMLLRSYIHTLAPNMSDVGYNEFDAAINSMFDEMKSDMNWVICSPTYARQNPLLLKQAIVRIFQGLKEILNETPVATPFASLLEEGLHMMDRAVPATKEYVDQNLHPAPRDVAEAQELYDMVVNEKAYFVGKPTPLMLRRWSRNLITIVSMLDGAKMKGTQLYEDSVNLCKSLIDQIQAQAKAQ